LEEILSILRHHIVNINNRRNNADNIPMIFTSKNEITSSNEDK